MIIDRDDRGTGASAPAIPLPAALLAETGRSLVGRRGQLAQLLERLGRADAGQRGLVVIAGEPGIGKTRLACELGRLGHERGAVTLLGRCDEEQPVPFQPFVEALEHYALHCSPAVLAEQAGGNAPSLARLVPGIAERLELAPAPPEDPDTARARLFAAVTALTDAIAAERPLILLLDDVHWADGASLSLLRHLVLAPEPAQLLVVATYRDAEVGAEHPLAGILGELRRAWLSHRVALTGLSEQEVTAFMTEWSGEPPPPALARALWGETEGHPFFMQELLRHLAETGTLEHHEGELGTSAAVERIGVPEGVKDVILRRIARLDERTRRVLAIASVIGRDFPTELLASVAHSAEPELLPALREAVAARLVTPAPGGERRYGFSHALVRETLYEGLEPERRVELHRGVAEALAGGAGRAAAPLAELARHYFEAATGGEDLGPAIDYALKAAEQAAEQLAYEEAASLYERAFHAMALRGGDARPRVRILLEVGHNRWRAGDFARARAVFLQAADLAERAELRHELAQAAVGYGGPMGFRAGFLDQVLVDLLERALQALPAEDSELRASVMGHLGSALAFSPLGAVPARARGIALGGEAVAMARRLGDPAVLAEVLSNTVVSRSGPDAPERRLASARETIALGDATARTPPRLEGRAWLIAHLIELGRMDEARTELTALERLVDEVRQPYYVSLVRMLGAMRALFEGRMEDAERLTWEALRIGQTAQNPSAVELFSGQIGVIRRLQGRLPETHGGSRAMAEHFVALPVFHCSFSTICAEMGLEDEARTQLELVAAEDFSLLPRDMFWLTSLEFLADTCARLDDRFHARRLYELLLPYAAQTIVIGAVAAPGGAATRALGVLATTLARFDEAEAHFRDALERNAAMGAVPSLAYTRLDFARMLLLRGRPEDAATVTELLAQVRETSDRHAMAGLAAAAEELAAAAAAPAGLGQAELRRSRRRLADVTGDAKALISVRGRDVMARHVERASDEELERRFSSPLAQRAVFTGLTRSFQPRMAFGFEGEILFELLAPAAQGPTGEGTTWWTIQVTAGRATARRRISDQPAVTVHIGISDFVRLVSGELNPMTAWASGRAQAEGDILLAARLPEMFGGVEPYEVAS